ncbi:YheU family protein [Alteromonas sp. C1M14]|uniref:YheU family protein n=1 Tax=Alteromonas sp. C1M14 TaxID=2841567 RepID=UPI001C08E5BA|nr:YheU family protein [Alteromonas sp. C1M14]MBU2978336.1 YheU family protein [Alteromonas sp. C1M14]
MIIPIDELDKDTLTNIAESFVLREGTDYGAIEASFEDKVTQVLQSLKSGDTVLVYSELHDSVNIQDKQEYRQADD